MLFWFFYLSFIIICLGRYNLAGYKLMPEKFAYPYVEFFIIIITVLRFNVGFDWFTYYKIVYPKLNTDYVSHFELIPRFFCFFAAKMKYPVLIFFLHQIPTLILLFYGFKKYSLSRYESLLVFFCLFYPDSLSIIRQYLAMAILFFAFKYVRAKKLLPYLLYSIIAFFCHKSSIIAAIAIYFLYNIISYKISIIISLIIFTVSKIGRDVLLNIISASGISYAWYLQVLNQFHGGSKVMYFLLGLCVILIPLVFTKRGEIESKKLYAIVLFGSIMPVVFGGHFGQRIGVYFYFYFVLLIPYAFSKLKIYYRSAFFVFFYFYLFLLLYINMISPVPTYIPYRFIFFHSF